MLHTHLQRRRLIDTIDEPYQAPVTIITAPAGYGKTILAEQWAESREHGVGFVTLHEQSNTPERIFSQMLAAIKEAAPDIDIPEIDGPPLDTLLDALKAISETGREISIILDD